jgi:hypothetical protein
VWGEEEEREWSCPRVWIITLLVRLVCSSSLD